MPGNITLSLRDALPISTRRRASSGGTYSSQPFYSAPAPAPTRIIKHTKRDAAIGAVAGGLLGAATSRNRSEEQTSALQSPCNLVCRRLLERKTQKLTYT